MKRHKITILKDIPINVRKNDIQFNFLDVQTKNPKTVNKTPLYLYIRSPIIKKIQSIKRWWENNNGK